jgi:hypothetical protein
MSQRETNEAILDRQFSDFRDKSCNPSIVDELAAFLAASRHATH